MENAIILVREVAVMALLIITGILCRKTAILTDESARSICSFLLMLVSPLMVVHALQKEKIPELMLGFGVAMIIAIVCHLIAIMLATFLIPNDGDPRFRVERLGVVFSNCGFMAFPLLAATMGEVGVLYGATYVGIFNVVSWTWGVITITGRPKISVKQLFINPGLIGFVVGLILFLSGISLPRILFSYTSHIYALNTPLSMVAIGTFLFSVDVKKVVRNPMVYWVTFLRNIATPGLLLLLFCVTGLSGWFPGAKEVASALLIVASCPCAASIILMPARFGGDSAHGASLITVSTAFALITMPVVAYFADMLL